MLLGTSAFQAHVAHHKAASHALFALHGITSA